MMSTNRDSKESKVMNAPKILITGASGFIGNSLYWHLNRLAPVGTYFSSTNTSRPTNWVQADIRSNLQVVDLLQVHQPDIIFHFAALPSPKRNNVNPILGEETNLLGIRHIVANLPLSTHLIFLSTDKVFDGSSLNPTENTSPSPITLYGTYKHKCEALIQSTLKKFHILRIGNVHALGDSASNSFIDKAIIKLRSNQQVQAFENVSRSYIRLEDLVGVLTSLMDDGHYGIYHLGSPLKSYFDRIRDLCEETGIEWRGNLMAASGDILPKTQNLNVEKIKKLLDRTFT